MGPTEGNTTQIQHLLDRAVEGNDDAYSDLIAVASERLQKLTARMLHNYPHLRRWEQTDDVFQNALIKLHRSLSDVKPESARHFFALATTQIRRTLIDLARHHFGPHGQAAKHHTDAGEKVTDGGRIIENQADRSETLESWTDFHETVERLPDAEREVFGLVWYGGMEQKEIAALLCISLPTVKRRWRAARV
jgi:RNA polymerase sigma-70 factor (ECF subfamily)